jgi:hypothetical protein
VPRERAQRVAISVETEPNVRSEPILLKNVEAGSLVMDRDGPPSSRRRASPCSGGGQRRIGAPSAAGVCSAAPLMEAPQFLSVGRKSPGTARCPDHGLPRRGGQARRPAPQSGLSRRYATHPTRPARHPGLGRANLLLLRHPGSRAPLPLQCIGAWLRLQCVGTWKRENAAALVFQRIEAVERDRVRAEGLSLFEE